MRGCTGLPTEVYPASFSVNKEVWEQLLAWINRVLVEVGYAMFAKHVFVDEEVPGAFTTGAGQNDVGGIGHDIDVARTVHDGVTT